MGACSREGLLTICSSRVGACSRGGCFFEGGGQFENLRYLYLMIARSMIEEKNPFKKEE